MSEASQKLIEAIQQYDAKGSDNEYSEALVRTIERAVDAGAYIDLISFTCSTINSEQLFSKTAPWLYVSDDPVGNNLTSDIGRLLEVVQNLKTVYARLRLKILIGNTDPYYIYLQQFKGFPEKDRLVVLKMFAVRWDAYKKNFEQWLVKEAPSLEAEVISWYEFEKEIEDREGISFEREYEKTLENITSFFSPRQFDWELERLKTQFGEGKYFEKLQVPKDELLRDWIKRKFAEYALQAKWIYENIPSAILIQNEKPSDLRSQMYQPLVKETYKTDFPIVYFFGVDNAGYQ